MGAPLGAPAGIQDCKLLVLVGERGFEPPTPWSRTKYFKHSKCFIRCRLGARKTTLSLPQLSRNSKFLLIHFSVSVPNLRWRFANRAAASRFLCPEIERDIGADSQSVGSGFDSQRAHQTRCLCGFPRLKSRIGEQIREQVGRLPEISQAVSAISRAAPVPDS